MISVFFGVLGCKDGDIDTIHWAFRGQGGEYFRTPQLILNEILRVWMIIRVRKMRGRSVYLVCPAHTAGSRSLGLSDLVIQSFSITQCCQPSRYQNTAPCQLDLDRSQGQDWPHVADDSKWGEQNLWHTLTCSNNKPLVESSPPDSYHAQLAHFRKVIVGVSAGPDGAGAGWLSLTS